MSNPGAASNVAETVPNAPPDQVVVVNGLPTGVVSGNSSTQVYLADVLGVGSGPSGLPAQNGLVSITNLPPSALQTFRFQ
ncbi:MAG: hypothetical protein WBQ40_04300 [Candidatus Sulfotelmatobacter sp.]